jgi:hypothetical protein
MSGRRQQDEDRRDDRPRVGVTRGDGSDAVGGPERGPPQRLARSFHRPPGPDPRAARPRPGRATGPPSTAGRPSVARSALPCPPSLSAPHARYAARGGPTARSLRRPSAGSCPPPAESRSHVVPWRRSGLPLSGRRSGTRRARTDPNSRLGSGQNSGKGRVTISGTRYRFSCETPVRRRMVMRR